MRAQLAVFSVLVAFMASAIVGRICQVPAVLALPALSSMGVVRTNFTVLGLEVMSAVVTSILSATVLVWLVLRPPLAARPSAWWVVALVAGYLLSLGAHLGTNMFATSYFAAAFTPKQWVAVTVGRTMGSLAAQGIQLASMVAVLLIIWNRIQPAGSESDVAR